MAAVWIALSGSRCLDHDVPGVTADGEWELLALVFCTGIAFSGSVRAVESKTVAPVAVKQVNPSYPKDVVTEGIEGTVVLSIEVKADGGVGKVDVKKGLHPRLDKAAVDAAKKWQFKPGTRDGKAVLVETELEMTFTAR